MAPHGTIRLVIVDDEGSLRELLGTWFSMEEGFTVVGDAADGDEAIELVERVQPDVVLLDVMMPGTDGLQALPEIRRRAPEAKVVVFTAAAPAFETRALESGAVACVDKAEDLAGLTSRLRELSAG